MTLLTLIFLPVQLLLNLDAIKFKTINLTQT